MEEEKITAKDPKKVEQGYKLSQISIKAKQNKARQKFMEEDDEELKKHFLSKGEEELRKKFLRENFSYLPYILYPIAGISTFALFVMLFKPSKPTVVYEATVVYEPKTSEEKKMKH